MLLIPDLAQPQSLAIQMTSGLLGALWNSVFISLGLPVLPAPYAAQIWELHRPRDIRVETWTGKGRADPCRSLLTEKIWGLPWRSRG